MKLGDWQFRTFHDGQFKLDGGAMFGVVPKVMWEKHHPADDLNRIDLDLRCLLVDHQDHRILVDTGMGDRWDEKMTGVFGLKRRPNHLVAELAEAGLIRESITDVVLTHLHFDHAGGVFREGENGLEAVFPNATFWVQQRQWDWAHNPSQRDRASFRIEDFDNLLEAGKLKLCDDRQEILPGVTVMPVNGHTPGQQIVEFNTGKKTVVFCGDLIPFLSQIHVPWIMGFDLNPMLTVTEKNQFLSRAAEEEFILVFEHDLENEAATVEFRDGKFRPLRTFTLDDSGF
ncbi:MAG: MBL fold metallo-hydrolase [bacterium]|nr:MBL fold metallo-hydrolase [bacterium]